MSNTARNINWLAATPAAYYATDAAKDALMFAAAVKLIAGNYTE